MSTGRLVGLRTLVVIGVIVLGLAMTWAAQGNSWFMFKVFAPKYEQVRRDTFEQSKAYRQGMVQEVQNMQFAYEQASPEHKTALRSIILHRVADFPQDALTPDLKTFIEGLKAQGAGGHE